MFSFFFLAYQHVGRARDSGRRRRRRRSNERSKSAKKAEKGVVQNTHKVNGVVVQRDLWSGQGSGQVMSGGGLARKFNFCFYLVYVTRHFFFLVPSIPPSTHTHTHTQSTSRTYSTATVKVR